MLNPYTGAPLEADPITLIIDRSGFDLCTLILIFATGAMVAREARK